MGADLIGYMVFGPNQITKTKADFEALYEQRKGVHTVDEDDQKNGKVEGVAPPDQEQWPFQEFPEYILNQEAFVRECESFQEFWNGDYTRDCCFRDNPFDTDGKVGFAGDMSWGDSPDGAGYQALEFVSKYELYDFFGLK